MTDDYRNRIFNLDCNVGLDLIPEGSVDLVVMDPPYLQGTGGARGAFGSRTKRYRKELDDIGDGISDELLDKIVSKLKAINIYVWCNKSQIHQYLDYFATGAVTMDLLTWHKTNPVPACSNKYLSDTEYCLFFREKGVKVYGTYETKRKWYVTPLNVSDKKFYHHPTIKPLDITRNLISNSLPPVGKEIPIVMDPFMGSGTTAVAAKMLGYDYTGFEIDEGYYRISQKRIAEAEDYRGRAKTTLEAFA